MRYTRGHVALERALSKLGAASRKEAQQLVRDGEVTVNGAIVRDPFTAVSPERDDIRVRGRRAERVMIRKRSRRETHLVVDLTEGKNREIRRLFKAIGHEVTRLLRVSFGPITLGTLKPGEWREVGRQELGVR